MTRHLTFANVTAVIALFVALGGASYAAIRLPAGSVDSQQLKRQAVTAPKLRTGAVRQRTIAPGSVGTIALTDQSITPAKLAFPLGALSARGEITGATGPGCPPESSLCPPPGIPEIGNLELPLPVSADVVVTATVIVTNTGDKPVPLSVWLLKEGDGIAANTASGVMTIEGGATQSLTVQRLLSDLPPGAHRIASRVGSFEIPTTLHAQTAITALVLPAR